MATRMTGWFRVPLLAIVLAACAGASALPLAAHAQLFGDRWGDDQPSRRQQQRPHDFFSFPFFDRPFNSPNSPPSFLPFGNNNPAPVESSKAPPPRKLETPPASTVVVIGDSLADWLGYGLEEIYADNTQLGVVRKIRPNSGLIHYDARNDSLEWSAAVKDILAAEKPAAIVVMLGLNDRVPLRDTTPVQGKPAAPAASTPGQPSQQGANSKPDAEAAQQPSDQPAAAATAAEAPHSGPAGSLEFRADKWGDLYSKRIDDMITALKSKGVPVLWVGLPAVRGPRATSDMSYLDDLYHAAADKAGIDYVDIWDGFVDENGRYTVQGPDFEGQTRRLRSSDGVHFTKVGAVKLAHLVDQDLKRVMANPAAPVAVAVPETGAPAKAGTERPAIGPVLPLTATGGASGDSGDLLGAGSHPAPLAGEDPTAVSVLVRGEAVPAPAGRADNFAWPQSVTSTPAASTAPTAPAANAAAQARPAATR